MANVTSHIRILAWIYIVVCGLLLVAGTILCVGLGLDHSPSSVEALAYIGYPFLFVSIGILVPGLVSGIGLLYMRPWARYLVLLPSTLLLFLIPVGTALGVYAYWIVLSPKADSEFRANASFFDWSPKLKLIGFMACVGAVMTLALKEAFIFHHDPVPSPLDNDAWTYGGIIVLLAGIVSWFVPAVRAKRKSVEFGHAIQDAKRTSESFKAKQEAYAYPHTTPPLVMSIAEEMDWIDKHVPYWERFGVIPTCEHLHPIEKAMVDAGINVRLINLEIVMAECRIDRAELERLYKVKASPPVYYVSFYGGDEAYHERPTAYISCDTHKVRINTVHPDEGGGRNVPHFPVAPNS
jgi:hypothetical protein